MTNRRQPSVNKIKFLDSIRDGGSLIQQTSESLRFIAWPSHFEVRAAANLDLWVPPASHDEQKSSTFP